MPSIQPIISRINKLQHFYNGGLPEYIAAFCFIYVVFVMFKHLIFHTGFYFWHRTGRKTINNFINKIFNTTTTERIFNAVNSKTKGKLTFQNIEHYSTKFASANSTIWYRSLLDDQKETAFLQEFNFISNKNVLFIIGDNFAQEVFLILSKAENKIEKFHILVNCDESEKIVKVLNQVFKKVDSDIAISVISFDYIKNDDTKYDFVYFGDDESQHIKKINFLLSKKKIKQKTTKIVINHAMNGGSDMVDFQMYVRRDERFNNRVLPGYLESCPKDELLVDGLEVLNLVSCK